MIDASKWTGRGGVSRDKILHGSDVPGSIGSFIDIEVIGVREAPIGFNSPLILDINPILDGRSAWSVNLTNVQVLAELVGNDMEALVGRKVRLQKVRTNNPSTHQEVDSLTVYKVSGPGVVVLPNKVTNVDDDIPF